MTVDQLEGIAVDGGLRLAVADQDQLGGPWRRLEAGLPVGLWLGHGSSVRAERAAAGSARVVRAPPTTRGDLMGIIRKTLSVSTLGVVSFRSKKELLRRAEKARRAAEAELGEQQSARAEADRRVAEAERRVARAELIAVREAKAAAKASKGSKGSGGRGRRGRKQARSARAREALGDLIATAQPAAEDTAAKAGRGAREGSQARKKLAERAQDEAGRRGRRAARKLRAMEDAVAPRVEAARDRAEAIKDDLVDLGETVVADVRDRAEEVRSRT